MCLYKWYNVCGLLRCVDNVSSFSKVFRLLLGHKPTITLARIAGVGTGVVCWVSPTKPWPAKGNTAYLRS